MRAKTVYLQEVNMLAPQLKTPVTKIKTASQTHHYQWFQQVMPDMPSKKKVNINVVSVLPLHSYNTIQYVWRSVFIGPSLDPA